MEHHIVSLDDGVYRWYRSLHCADKILQGVKIDELGEHYV